MQIQIKSLPLGEGATAAKIWTLKKRAGMRAKQPAPAGIKKISLNQSNFLSLRDATGYPFAGYE